jgi:hypothetical protein
MCINNLNYLLKNNFELIVDEINIEQKERKKERWEINK